MSESRKNINLVDEVMNGSGVWSHKRQAWTNIKEELANLKAQNQRMREAIGYCSTMIIVAVESIKENQIIKADQQLNSGLSSIQEALKEVGNE